MSSPTTERLEGRPGSLRAQRPQDLAAGIAAPPSTGRTGVVRAGQWCFGASFVLIHFRQYPMVKPALLVLSAVAVLLLLASGPQRLTTCRLSAPLTLFVLWCAASLAWTADVGGTAVALVTLVSTAALATASGCLLTRDELSTVLVTCVKAVLAVTVLALVVAPGWSTAPAAADGALGWHGPFSHKNGLGAFLVIAALTLLVLPTRRRWLWATVTAVLLLGSQSSTALAIMLVVVTILVWRAGARRLHAPSARGSLTTLAGSAVVAVGLVVAAAPGQIAGVLGRNVSLTGRTEIWDAVERQIRLRPVQGWGWGGVWRPTSAPTLEMWREARFQAYYAHNGYLDVTLQVGAVGAVLLLLVLLTTVLRQLQQPSCRLAVWGALILLTLCLSALSESGPFTDQAGLFLVFLLATTSLQHQPSAVRRA